MSEQKKCTFNARLWRLLVKFLKFDGEDPSLNLGEGAPSLAFDLGARKRHSGFPVLEQQWRNGAIVLTEDGRLSFKMATADEPNGCYVDDILAFLVAFLVMTSGRNKSPAGRDPNALAAKLLNLAVRLCDVNAVLVHGFSLCGDERAAVSHPEVPSLEDMPNIFDEVYAMLSEAEAANERASQAKIPKCEPCFNARLWRLLGVPFVYDQGARDRHCGFFVLEQQWRNDTITLTEDGWLAFQMVNEAFPNGCYVDDLLAFLVNFLVLKSGRTKSAAGRDPNWLAARILYLVVRCCDAAAIFGHGFSYCENECKATLHLDTFLPKDMSDVFENSLAVVSEVIKVDKDVLPTSSAESADSLPTPMEE